MKKLSKPLAHVKQNIAKSRSNIDEAQQALVSDTMNKNRIEGVKKCNEELIRWNEIEEDMLRKMLKLDWLKLGDGNNLYFHAFIKAKQPIESMNILHKDDVTTISSQKDIEDEVMSYYENLLSKREENLKYIDVVAMRKGKETEQDAKRQLEHTC